jgi:hypothetical protein
MNMVQWLERISAEERKRSEHIYSGACLATISPAWAHLGYRSSCAGYLQQVQLRVMASISMSTLQHLQVKYNHYAHYEIPFALFFGLEILRCYVMGSRDLTVGQAVSRRLPTAAARFRAQVISCKTVVVTAALGQVFSEYFGFTCHLCISLIASQSIIQGWYIRTINERIHRETDFTPTSYINRKGI